MSSAATGRSHSADDSGKYNKNNNKYIYIYIYLVK